MTENVELKLDRICVSDMANNCYLLHDDTEGLLIDAADNAAAILDMARRNGVKITKVLTTHRHSDHTRALKEVLEKTDAEHYASYLDSPALPAPVDVELNNGDVIAFAGHHLPVFILRGHTPGGACVAARINGVPNLFVGDSLFPGGVGKTNSEGDFIRLFKDVKERVFEAYRDESIIYPGHGAPTTVGDERPKLEEWWARRW